MPHPTLPLWLALLKQKSLRQMYVMSGRDFVKTTEQFLADFYFIEHNYLLADFLVYWHL